MKSECAQGPPAIKVERSLVVALRVGLHEGQRANALKVQLRLKDVVTSGNDRHQVRSLGRQYISFLNPEKSGFQCQVKSISTLESVGLYEGRRANALKVHQQLRLKDDRSL